MKLHNDLHDLLSFPILQYSGSVKLHNNKHDCLPSPYCCPSEYREHLAARNYATVSMTCPLFQYCSISQYWECLVACTYTPVNVTFFPFPYCSTSRYSVWQHETIHQQAWLAFPSHTAGSWWARWSWQPDRSHGCSAGLSTAAQCRTRSLSLLGPWLHRSHGCSAGLSTAAQCRTPPPATQYSTDTEALPVKDTRSFHFLFPSHWTPLQRPNSLGFLGWS